MPRRLSTTLAHPCPRHAHPSPSPNPRASLHRAGNRARSPPSPQACGTRRPAGRAATAWPSTSTRLDRARLPPTCARLPGRRRHHPLRRPVRNLRTHRRLLALERRGRRRGFVVRLSRSPPSSASTTRRGRVLQITLTPSPPVPPYPTRSRSLAGGIIIQFSGEPDADVSDTATYGGFFGSAGKSPTLLAAARCDGQDPPRRERPFFPPSAFSGRSTARVLATGAGLASADLNPWTSSSKATAALREISVSTTATRTARRGRLPATTRDHRRRFDYGPRRSTPPSARHGGACLEPVPLRQPRRYRDRRGGGRPTATSASPCFSGSDLVGITAHAQRPAHNTPPRWKPRLGSARRVPPRRRLDVRLIPAWSGAARPRRRPRAPHRSAQLPAARPSRHSAPGSPKPRPGQVEPRNKLTTR